MRNKHIPVALMALLLLCCTAQDGERPKIPGIEQEPLNETPQEQEKQACDLSNTSAENKSQNLSESVALIPDNLTQDDTEIQKEDDTKNPTEDITPKEKIIMFHNGVGPMCREQLAFLEGAGICDALELEQHLTSDPDYHSLLLRYKSSFSSSQGVSESFSYLPITFVNDHAYSGFNEKTKSLLEDDIKSICGRNPSVEAEDEDLS